MAKKDITVEEKLRALYDLQLIDSRIDEIRNVRGELPLEVEDLEDEVAGLNTRLSNLANDVTSLESDISAKKQAITELKEIQFRPTIDIGDIKVKTKRINGFLSEGHKVKLIMQVICVFLYLF